MVRDTDECDKAGIYNMVQLERKRITKAWLLVQRRLAPSSKSSDVESSCGQRRGEVG